MKPIWNAVVLDAQALSLWLDSDRGFMARLNELVATSTPLVVCANTLIELANHPAHRRLDWLISRTCVEPVTTEVARVAADLLRNSHMTGHRQAIDASMVAVALRHIPPVAIMTSDPADIHRLSQSRLDILPL